MSGKFYIFLSSLLGEGVAHLPHLAHLLAELLVLIEDLLVRNR